MLKHSSTAVTRPFSSLEPKAVRKLSRETRPESHAVSKQQNNSQSLQDLKTPKLTYKTPTQKLKQQTNNCTTASGQQKSHAYGITFLTEQLGRAPQLGLPERSSTGFRVKQRAACARAPVAHAKRDAKGGAPSAVRGAPHSDVKLGRKLTLSGAHLLELAAYSRRLADLGT